MDTATVVVHGVVRPDGSLELSEKVSLPPGKVQVTVVPIPDLPQADPFWQRMQAIWDARRAAGLLPRTEQEVEAERRQTREEWDDRMREIERTQQSGSDDNPPTRDAP